MTAAAPHVPVPKNGVCYRGKYVLAPMVRSGELPSRLMALHYGADLVWGPETVDRSLIGTTIRTNPRTSCIEYSRVSSNGGRVGLAVDPRENTIFRIHPALESSRLIFQIGTADPGLAVQAASLVAPYCAGIDVNSGCPKPFSTSGGMGAALLSTPDLLCDILRALVRQVGEKWEIGISVKIRLLATEAETRALVERLCGTGITGLTIHCRTRSMRKTEKAIRDQLRMVGDVCRAAGVACLMNGDVESREQAEVLARDFGVDGAMIATAAEKNPSVFHSAARGGFAGWRELAARYMDYAIDVENRWANTKFLLAQMVPGRELERMKLAQAKNYSDVVERLGLRDEGAEEGRLSLGERAGALDALLGITDRLTRAEQKANKAQQALQVQQAQQQAQRDARKRSPPGGGRHGAGQQAKKVRSDGLPRPAVGLRDAANAPADAPRPDELAADEASLERYRTVARARVSHGADGRSDADTVAPASDYQTDLHHDIVAPSVRV